MVVGHMNKSDAERFGRRLEATTPDINKKSMMIKRVHVSCYNDALRLFEWNSQLSLFRHCGRNMDKLITVGEQRLSQ